MAISTRIQLCFQRTMLAGAITLCVGSILDAQSDAKVSQEQPNVLFIAVDDLNDWTGHLAGHPQARTPNIDRLVARGVTFTNAHCAAPACNPSRAALMSGLRPWETGIYTNGDPAEGVLRNTLTINRHFLANGYKVKGGGKIYHNFAAEGRDDTWSEWVGLFPTAGGNEHKLNGLLLLAVGYVKPHLPWYVPQEFYDRFPLDNIQLPVITQNDLSDVPPAGRAMAKPDGDHAAVLQGDQWKQAVQGYLATISFLDDEVGRLLEGLENSPKAQNTIVVWWTDHGWHLGEKEHWRKFALWEKATRTSFAIAAPGVTTAGTRLVAAIDYTNIYPTLCELTGLPIPEHAHGPSLMPLFKDPTKAWDHVAICTHGRGNHAARDARYRYIRYANGDEELYDHNGDPHEWTNIASCAEMAEVKLRLSKSFPPNEAPPTLAD